MRQLMYSVHTIYKIGANLNLRQSTHNMQYYGPIVTDQYTELMSV